MPTTQAAQFEVFSTSETMLGNPRELLQTSAMSPPCFESNYGSREHYTVSSLVFELPITR